LKRGYLAAGIGDPGELTSAERSAFQGNGVASTVGNESVSGQDAYVLGLFNEFTRVSPTVSPGSGGARSPGRV
jgi:hypothetical protein